MNKYTPTVLTIAGSDPYGGAGIQIDTKTIHALGCYAFSVPTALTAQSSTGVKAVFPISADIFSLQLEAICEDVHIDAVKIGMLANSELVCVVANAIKKYHLKNIVLDTPFISSSGKQLLDDEAIETMVSILFPLVDIVTPNIPETNRLLNIKYSGKEDEVESVSKAFFKLKTNSVLLKGGHSKSEEMIDFLVQPNMKIDIFKVKKILTTHTHGTGCILSSAIAAGMAQKFTLENSVGFAKQFLYQKLQDTSSMHFHYKCENAKRKEPVF
jgi:hydroxymethylpyrimidine/phosphomethylpyrimidine kinase